jgi:hypothetical protein
MFRNTCCFCGAFIGLICYFNPQAESMGFILFHQKRPTDCCQSLAKAAESFNRQPGERFSAKGKSIAGMLGISICVNRPIGFASQLGTKAITLSDINDHCLNTKVLAGAINLNAIAGPLFGFKELMITNGETFLW